MTKARSIASQCQAAYDVAPIIGALSTDAKNAGLVAMAQALKIHSAAILTANEKDLSYGRSAGISTALLDRLTLTPARIEGMADSLLAIRDLEDPIGEVLTAWTLENGLAISKVRVPFGVIGIIYEARPNVTADAIGLAIKSSNCVVLRGSKSAIHSNQIISNTLRDAFVSQGGPAGAIQLLEDTTHEGVTELVQMKQYLSLVIPRGGAGLIKRVVETATVPAIETGVGNCHVYVDQSADLKAAVSIAVNAKVQRPSVCNACETVLVHKDVASTLLPLLSTPLKESNVVIRGCEKTKVLLPDCELATEDDWYEEYHDLILAIRVVDSIDEALTHIRQYGSMHTEAILSENPEAISKFLNQVDAAAVIANASTRFTDGGVFGFGAEMGISTQKLHARGPMGLKELTTYKYIVKGDGQIRT
ncbi:glutamate-5-semialdehyde dehydrogenase [bacterium]|nr:glutamate-5-semialdehyde dehydrogenase [bacterium]